MQFKLLETYISKPRIARFLSATGGNQNLARDLYLDNLILSQAFHPLLGIVEVTLRNAINEELAVFFADQDWVINQKSGFMQHPTLTFYHRVQQRRITNDYLLKRVIEAELKLQRDGKTPNAGRIIAELTFGFWTKLYDPTHASILLGRPMQVFPNLPPNINRANIYRILNEIRLFRNRLSHNEPICFAGFNYDCRLPRRIHQDIIKILSWIEPDIVTWIKPLDFVEDQIKAMDAKYL